MNTIRMSSLITAGLVLVAAGTQAQEFAKPGADQEKLKQMTGVWDAQVKNILPMPEESKGEFTAKLDLGGYFLVTEFKGKMGGQPFQGRGVTGYDPFKKKYVGIWVDSMSPALYATEGAFDKAGKVYTESMEGPDPQGKPMKMRTTTEIKDKDRMHFQLYTRGEDGKDTLMMEIAYTRKK